MRNSTRASKGLNTKAIQREWKPEVKQNKAYDTLMSYEKEQLSKEKKKGKVANRIISGLRFLSAYYAKVNPIAKT